MRIAWHCVFVVWCFLMACLCPWAAAGESVATVIPSDALAYVVVHNLADVSQTVDGLAGLMQAPAPGLLNHVKMVIGLEKGLDEQGDFATVVTQILPIPKTVGLMPVSNFADFCAALKVAEPTDGVVSVQLAGQPMLMGRKGDFAALAWERDRDALEHVLSSTTSIASEGSLAEWLDSNKVSAALNSRGLKQVLPQLTAGIRVAQAGIRSQANESAQTAADAMEIYVKLFTAAEAEVEKVAVGLRVDAEKNVAIVKQVDFNPEGTWIKWIADAKPASQNLLVGLPDVPFIVAGGGVLSPTLMDQMMDLSVGIMKSMPAYKLTPEQAQKYVDLSKGAMRGVQSMSMVLGVAEPGAGLYGNTTALMTVDDSQRYLKEYEASLSKLTEFAREVKNPMIPVATCQRIKVGEIEALEVSMDMKNMPHFSGSGAPEQKKVIEMMFGSGDALKIFVAPADEHTIVMSYVSSERLQQVLDFVKSSLPGLSENAQVAQVAALVPGDCQIVGYISLNGVVSMFRQFAEAFNKGQAPPIPDFAECPPLGIACKATEKGVEGHMVITAGTLKAFGDTVAQARSGAAAPK